MRVPERLESLLDHGVIEEVLRPLMSGKEAEVYLVRSGGEERVAKVYKNAQFRSFQHRAEYTEGRRVRSSREQRAMTKRSKHGRAKTEDAWRSAEVDAIHRLREAGVRVPEPFAFADGVLVMELVKDETGAPAPRLVDSHFSPEEAVEVFDILLREVVKMLCAGVVHADLSDFNVLLSADGPVIIDFPQAVDPARNQSARKLLVRDVKNLTGFLGRFAPQLRSTKYGMEMWDLYERSELAPDTELTGKYEPSKKKSEVSSLLDDILELEQEARERREALGLPPPRRARRPVVFEKAPEPQPAEPRKRRGRNKDVAPGKSAAPSRPTQGNPDPGKQATSRQPAPAPVGEQSSGKKRRRRRKRSGGAQAPANGSQPQAAQAASQGGRPAAQAGPEPTPDRASSKPASNEDGPRPSRRRRRRRRSGGGGGGGGGSAGANG